jgi:hypothetical protein
MNETLFFEALHLFNQGEFFEAHEAWEDVWRVESGPDRRTLQGLIQIAVALHHHSTGNIVGARSLLRRGRQNLAQCPAEFAGRNMPHFLQSIDEWQRALDAGADLPALPKL